MLTITRSCSFYHWDKWTSIHQA